MRLTPRDALARLAEHDHGVLATVHTERGVDVVPVVYVVIGDHLAVPVDLVKPKESLRLQRERNLETDDRATLLVEHWNRDDWSHLWWVRARMRWDDGPPDNVVDAATAALAERFPQYHDRPFARLILFHLHTVTGWSATP
jgi:PPOX class probable F420-dependent enzyme